MRTSGLQNLLVCIARALTSEQRHRAVAAGLLPVQWSILTYLRNANRYSNTPQALTEYLSATKGTVSQSLKLLEKRGWIRRTVDRSDRRVIRLALTYAGRAQLGDAIANEWEEAAERLTKRERKVIEVNLSKLLREWQQTRQGRTFGVCRSCRHFRLGDRRYHCGLTGEVLSEDDSTRICREHEQSPVSSGVNKLS